MKTQQHGCVCASVGDGQTWPGFFCCGTASRPEFSQKPGRGRGRPTVRATVANFIPDQTNFHISCSGRPLFGELAAHTRTHEYTHNWHGNGCNLLLQKKKRNFKEWVTLQWVGGTDFLKAFGRYSNLPPPPSHSNFPFSGATKKSENIFISLFCSRKKEEKSSEEDLKRRRRVS